MRDFRNKKKKIRKFNNYDTNTINVLDDIRYLVCTIS